MKVHLWCTHVGTFLPLSLNRVHPLWITICCCLSEGWEKFCEVDNITVLEAKSVHQSVVLTRCKGTVWDSDKDPEHCISENRSHEESFIKQSFEFLLIVQMSVIPSQNLLLMAKVKFKVPIKVLWENPPTFQGNFPLIIPELMRNIYPKQPGIPYAQSRKTVSISTKSDCQQFVSWSHNIQMLLEWWEIKIKRFNFLKGLYELLVYLMSTL